MNTHEREAEAFRQAYEAARAMERDPKAWARLREAVRELVRLGAILPGEALDFESLLSSRRGRFLLEAPGEPSQACMP